MTALTSAGHRVAGFELPDEQESHTIVVGEMLGEHVHEVGDALVTREPADETHDERVRR